MLITKFIQADVHGVSRHLNVTRVFFYNFTYLSTRNIWFLVAPSYVIFALFRFDSCTKDTMPVNKEIKTKRGKKELFRGSRPLNI